MAAEIDLTALSVDELVALVHELRQKLAERDVEITRLKSARLTERDSSPTEDSQVEDSAGPPPGSQEDLLAQLEQLYPDGK
ncbi:MAG: hypothetical protein HY267_05490 [Deltaproteobacteria bacterium]|nr:hypothetical protein [Deltaproteobacteria bacterium]